MSQLDCTECDFILPTEGHSIPMLAIIMLSHFYNQHPEKYPIELRRFEREVLAKQEMEIP